MPVNPALEETVAVNVPLSAGAEVGVRVIDPPEPSVVFGYVPTVGAVFAGTATFNVASLNAPFVSVTRKVKLAAVAVQDATTSAVTTPAALTAMLETVTPVTVAVAPPLTVTTSVLAVWSGSFTVAICEFVTGLPCCLDTPACAVIVGGALTITWNWLVVVEPQMSVEVTVTVKVPDGSAPVIVTTPVV